MIYKLSQLISQYVTHRILHLLVLSLQIIFSGFQCVSVSRFYFGTLLYFKKLIYRLTNNPCEFPPSKRGEERVLIMSFVIKIMF